LSSLASLVLDFKVWKLHPAAIAGTVMLAAAM
jgi:hypothetical protein